MTFNKLTHWALILSLAFGQSVAIAGSSSSRILNATQIKNGAASLVMPTSGTATTPNGTYNLLGDSLSQVVTGKDIDGGTASDASRITLPKASTSTLSGLTRKQGTIAYDTTLGKPVFDSGSAFVALATSVSTSAPTIQKFTSTGTTTGYLFTISTSSTVAVGDTYTNNAHTYTVLAALSAQTGQVLFMSGASAPTASGTLARATGSGTASITFTAATALATYTTPTSPAPLYIRVRMVGGGGGGGGSGTTTGSSATAGGNTTFGALLLAANGGSGGGGSGGAGGAGGTASLGTGPVGIAVSGGGGMGAALSSSNTNLSGGAGATGFFGGGGKASGATNTGSGGAGGDTGGTTAFAGAGGGAGGYVDAIITSPSATYYYTVGASGAAGGAGTSGFGGNAGGSGVIIVEEHYQ